MPYAAADPLLAELRSRIARLKQGRARDRAALPFGVPSIDAVLPGGGLAFGSLHEVAGGGDGAVDGAAARVRGQTLWCVMSRSVRR